MPFIRSTKYIQLWLCFTSNSSKYVDTLWQSLERLSSKAVKISKQAKDITRSVRQHQYNASICQISAYQKLLEPAEEEEEEAIVFESAHGLMIDPEALLLRAADQDFKLYPTLLLLRPQNVQVLAQYDLVLSIFRQQLLDKQNHSTAQLQNGAETNRWKAIDRKLSLIRRGDFEVPIMNTKRPKSASTF